MKVLIIGLGTVGSNFVYSLTKTKLTKKWNISMIDCDEVVEKNIISTPYTNIGNSKVSECLRMLLNNMTSEIRKFLSIGDSTFGRIETKRDKTFHYDIIVDCRDSSDPIPKELVCDKYFKLFINSQFAICYDRNDHLFDATNYDAHPEMWFTLLFCKHVIKNIEKEVYENFVIYQNEILKKKFMLEEEVNGKRIIFNDKDTDETSGTSKQENDNDTCSTVGEEGSI